MDELKDLKVLGYCMLLICSMTALLLSDLSTGLRPVFGTALVFGVFAWITLLVIMATDKIVDALNKKKE